MPNNPTPTTAQNPTRQQNMGQNQNQTSDPMPGQQPPTYAQDKNTRSSSNLQQSVADSSGVIGKKDNAA